MNLETGEIKIGQTKHPLKRLEQIREIEKAPLVLLGILEDVVPLEKKLHRKFESFRTRGEWFKATLPLLDYINKLNGGYTVLKSPNNKPVEGPLETAFYSIELVDDNYELQCKHCNYVTLWPSRMQAARSGNAHSKMHKNEIIKFASEE